MSLALLEVQGEEMPGRDVDYDILRSSMRASPSTPRTRPILNSSWWTGLAPIPPIRAFEAAGVDAVLTWVLAERVRYATRIPGTGASTRMPFSPCACPLH